MNNPGMQRRLANQSDFGGDNLWSLQIESDAEIGGRTFPTITIANQITHELDKLDVLMLRGLEIGPYLKNPVVGYNHGFGNGDSISTPVARTVSLSLVNEIALRASWEWVPDGLDVNADRVRKLWEARFIHAASIWYRPDYKSAEIVPGHESDFWPPVIFHRSLMKEWCFCYVPEDSFAVRNNASRNAARRARQRGRHRLSRRELANQANVPQQLVIPIGDLSQRLSMLKEDTDDLLKKLKG